MTFFLIYGVFFYLKGYFSYHDWFLFYKYIMNIYMTYKRKKLKEKLE
jgi:hypothetical protein